MEYTQELGPTGLVIALSGAFTFKDHHSFRVILDALNGGGTRHVVDMSGLTFVDSAALGMLLIAKDESEGGGWDLTLRRPQERVAKIMELAALDTVFRIEP